MTAAASLPTLTVAGIGPLAHAALREDARGRVLAVFRRSFYLQMESSELVCLGPRALGAGPLNALCEVSDGLPWPKSAVGDLAWVRDAVLCVGEGGRFALGQARPWAPAALPPVSPARRVAGLALLRHGCGESMPPRGLAASLLAAPENRGAPPPALEAALHRQVGVAVTALQHWLAHADGTPVAPVPEALPGLLGLGGGLTPAGDDLLGGALIALRALGQAGPADRLAAALLAVAPGRTGRISAAHLAAAAQGLGAAPLHYALEALAELDAAGLVQALRALDGIGHTSGWDALAGVAAVWGADTGTRAPAEAARAPSPVSAGGGLQGEFRSC